MENTEQLSDAVEKITLTGDEVIIALDGRNIKIPLPALKLYLGLSAVGAVVPTKAPSFDLGAPADAQVYFGGAGDYTLDGVTNNYPKDINILFWDKTNWSVLGISIDLEGYATQSEVDLIKNTIDAVSVWIEKPYEKENLFDKSGVVNEKVLDATTGLPVSNVGGQFTGFIPVISNTSYLLEGLKLTPTPTRRIWFYTASGTPISYATVSESNLFVETPENTASLAFNTKVASGTWDDDINRIVVSKRYYFKNYLELNAFVKNGASVDRIDTLGFATLTLKAPDNSTRIVSSDSIVTALSIDAGALARKPDGSVRKFYLRLLGLSATSGNYAFGVVMESDTGSLKPGVFQYTSSTQFQLSEEILFLSVSGVLDSSFTIKVKANINWEVLQNDFFDSGANPAPLLYPLIAGYTYMRYLYGGRIDSKTPIVLNDSIPTCFMSFVKEGITIFPEAGGLEVKVRQDSDIEIYFNGSVWLYKVIKEYNSFTLGKGAITPNDFLEGTQTERMQAAVNFIKVQGGGELYLPFDSIEESNVWLLSSALVVPSNFKLILGDGITLKLADGVFDNVIRPDSIVIDPSKPYSHAFEVGESFDISILGAGVGRSFISGADVPYTAPSLDNPTGPAVPWVGDTFGWRCISLALANVKGYRVEGISFLKSKNWTITQESGCENGHFLNLDFQTDNKNGDGIDFRGGCNNVTVENISGNTTDDLIAFTCIRKDVDVAGSYSNRITKAADYGEWLISDIDVKNVKGSSKTHNVIILAASGGKINNIRINNVEEYGPLTASQVVRIYTGYGINSVLGDITNISINKVVANKTPIALQVSAPLKDSQINYIEQQKAGAIAYSVEGLGSTQENVTVTNVIEP